MWAPGICWYLVLLWQPGASGLVGSNLTVSGCNEYRWCGEEKRRYKTHTLKIKGPASCGLKHLVGCVCGRATHSWLQKVKPNEGLCVGGLVCFMIRSGGNEWCMMDWTGGETDICAVNRNDKDQFLLVQQILVPLPSEAFNVQQKNSNSHSNYSDPIKHLFRNFLSGWLTLKFDSNCTVTFHQNHPKGTAHVNVVNAIFFPFSVNWCLSLKNFGTLFGSILKYSTF